jgi:hypothetical protein
MRILAFFLLTTALAFSQNLTEFGAAAAGSTVGGASGKSVSNSITAIFGKVNQPSAKAPVKETVTETEKETKSEKEPQADVSKVTPGASIADPSGVPPAPSPAGKRTAPAPLPVAQFIVPEDVARISSWADVAPALPPPPVMSPEDLRSVSVGSTRADVLKFGAPSSKITMFEDGHVVELYSYHQNGQKFGGLRLIDGVVTSIQ